MSEKNSNGILRTTAVIAESFRNINITEEGILELLDNRIFISLFDSVPDFRQKGKVIYRLSSILLLVFLTVLRRGKGSFYDIAYVIKANKRTYMKYGLLPEDGSTPSHDTIRRILTVLDGDALYENTIQGFYLFLESLKNHYAMQGDYRHLCIDGKEMRGSGRASTTNNPQRNYAMLNIYEASSLTIIECEPIDTKENEIPVAQRLLKQMDLKNAVVTADALHCQKETASIIHAGKGKYLLIAKDNQKSLSDEIKARFNKYPEKVRTSTDGDRTIDILELPRNYALSDEWAGLKCFVRMVSKKCTRYFITNTADDLLIRQAVENRWMVETFHKLKDYDMQEDAVRSTDKQALRNIATLNNLGEQLFTLFQTITGLCHKEAKVYFQENTIECLNVILSVMSSEQIVDSLVKDLKKRRRKRNQVQ